MRVKWGNKNESLTLTIGGGLDGSDVSRDFDKMILGNVEKQMCDVHLYKAQMARRAHIAELEVKCLEADLEKGKNLWRFLWRFIKWPVAF
jgi:hypothetical protein